MASDVIAIDGPAASGKSTVAKLIARRLGIPYINTGNMYRAVTLFLLENSIPLESAAVTAALPGLSLAYVRGTGGDFQIILNQINPGEKLRSPEVAACVSTVAAMPVVRAWLVEKQRQFAASGQVVMEGRDIGTVIFPDARYKFFVTATPEERARRRLAQTSENPDGATIESVAQAIAERDKLDAERAVAPLRRADDALLLDTTG
jgi:cytidylate kinase